MSRSHLAQGLLIGRYARCFIGTSGDNLDQRVSRVHLLLAEDQDRILAIDTASLNGTTVDGEPLSIAILKDQAVLELGGSIHVLWKKKM